MARGLSLAINVHCAHRGAGWKTRGANIAPKHPSADGGKELVCEYPSAVTPLVE